MNLQENLIKYARLILKVGLSVKPGDNLLIRVNEDGLPLCREIAKQAHELGAHHIHLAFSDDQIDLARYEHAPEEAFDSIPKLFADFNEAAYNSNFHLLSLRAPNPELLKSVSPDRIKRWQMTTARAGEHVMKYVMENRVKWCVVALPSKPWAKSVFPDLSEDEALAALWKSIFKVTRVDQEDPVAAWEAHDKGLSAREQFLNEQRFVKLIYQAPGTDLTVELPEGHLWIGGGSQSVSGEKFMANIPTEEIFTMPHAFKVNGALKATKPLSTRGRLIEGMSFVFQDGKVVDFDATSGKDILGDLLDTDEGSRRLGEVALVPDDSPISQTGLLFKNTLFDENAACHFALGQAYGENHVRGNEMTAEEKKEAGMNQSIIHVDFMVGSPELNVTGVKADGSLVSILKNGNWAI